LGPLLSALHFLTIIPLLPERPYSNDEFGRAVGFFPLVGLIIGGILVLIQFLLSMVFPEIVIAVLLLVSWLAITGAIHLDGLLDSFDGLLGGRERVSRLEIMKDERIGAFGFAAGVSLILIKFSVLSSLVGTPASITGLILAPTLGRWSLTLAIFFFPYARDHGLGRNVKDRSTWRQIALATGTSILVASFIYQWMGLVIMLAVALVVWLCARFTIKRISGLTGDIYGAICEITELVVLLLLVIQWNY
jgi:adenosylcobinamide-GDP ribazoletransferase